MLPDTGGTDRVLLATLRWQLDKDSYDKVVKGTLSVKDALKQAEEQAKKNEAALNKMRESAEKLGQVSQTLMGIGAAITGPLLLAAKQYVDFAGKAEGPSSRWLKATESLEQSTMRIGRTATEALVPALEKVADLAEKAASYAEKNPDVIKAALAIGGGTLALGTLGQIASTTLMTVASLKLLAGPTGLLGKMVPGIMGNLALTGAGGVTGGSLAAAASPVPILGGLLVGSTISKALGNMDLGEFLGKSIALAVGGVTRLQSGSKERGDAAFMGVARFFGQLPETTAATDNAVKSEKELAEARAKEQDLIKNQTTAYMAWYKADQKANEDYLKKRNQAIEDYNNQAKEAESQYQSQRVSKIQNFIKQESRTEQDYYTDRMKTARDYNKEVQRSEEDHQKELRRSREDHQMRVEDMLAEGDARGIINENRNYEKDRQRSEEDYLTEAARKSEDYATKIADAEAAFVQDRARRQDDFISELKTMDAEYTQQRQKASAEFANSMNRMQDEFEQERAARRQKLVEDFQEMNKTFSEAWDYWLGFSGAMRQDLANLQAQAKQTIGSKAIGGYVSAGNWRLHDGEFVLNAATTRAAEQVAQQRLDQDTILSMLGGGPGRGSVTWNDHRKFDSRLSVEDRMAIRQDNINMLTNALQGA